MAQFLEQSVAVTICLGPFLDKADGLTAETGLTTDYLLVYLSKNGGDVTSKHDATDLAHAGAGAAATSLGYYHCVLDTTDTNTLGLLRVMVSDEAVHLPVWQDYMVVTHDAYQSLCGDHVIGAAAITAYDPPTNTEFEARSLPSADYVVTTDTIAGCTLVATTTTVTNGVTLAADAITAAKIADDAFSSEHFATGALTDDAVADSFFDVLADDTDIGTAVWANATGAAVYAGVVTGAAGTDVAADIIALKAVADTIAGDTTTDIPALIDALPTAAEVWSNATGAAVYAGVVTNAAGTDVAADIIALKTVADTIATDTTTDIPLTITTLSTEVGKIPKSDGTSTWNDTALAAIQTQANDALVANNLDHLALTATVAADMTAEVADNTVLSRILGNGDTSTFVPSTDGLHAAGVDLDAVIASLAAQATTADVALAVLDQGLATGDADALDARTVRSALRILRNYVSMSAGVMSVKKENDTDNAWTAAITTDAGAANVTIINPT